MLDDGGSLWEYVSMLTHASTTTPVRPSTKQYRRNRFPPEAPAGGGGGGASLVVCFLAISKTS